MSNFAPVLIKCNKDMIRKSSVLMTSLAALLFTACSDKKSGSETPKPVKVNTMTVTEATHTGGQGYSGTIEEQSGSTLSFAAVGTLKSVNVSEGQTVRAGQLIATIDEASLQSAYEAALAAKEQALDAEQRMKLLHDAGSLPEIKWIEVQTQVRQALAAEKMAKKALTDAKLYAPFSGYIVQKQAEAGQSVAPGVPIVKLVKIDQVKVSISVPEDEIAQIQKGQTLHVTIAALGGKQFEAKVTEKGVAADALSRSYVVKGVMGNPGHELLPGMIAEVEASPVEGDLKSPDSQVADFKSATAIALPAEIIQIDADNKTFVWTVVGGKAQKTYITIGENIGDRIAVSSGLKEGDKVICEGQQKVSNGVEVKSEE